MYYREYIPTCIERKYAGTPSRFKARCLIPNDEEPVQKVVEFNDYQAPELDMNLSLSKGNRPWQPRDSRDCCRQDYSESCGCKQVCASRRKCHRCRRYKKCISTFSSSESLSFPWDISHLRRKSWKGHSKNKRRSDAISGKTIGRAESLQSERAFVTRVEAASSGQFSEEQVHQSVKGVSTNDKDNGERIIGFVMYDPRTPSTLPFITSTGGAHLYPMKCRDKFHSGLVWGLAEIENLINDSIVNCSNITTQSCVKDAKDEEMH